MNKLTLSQLDYLVNGLLDDRYIKENYDLSYSDLYNKLENITEKQKSYLWACMYHKKHGKMKELLHGLGIDRTRKFEACNGCGEDHEPEECTHGFNQ